MIKGVLICIIFILFSFFASLYIGVFEIPDAYFYYVLGHYLITGNLLPVAPLNAEIPQTLFGPMYALLSYPLVYIKPGIQLTLPFLQLVMIGLSSLLLYFSLKQYLSKPMRLASSIVFILLPFNLLYAFVFMSEITTMFLVALTLYVFMQLKPEYWKRSIVLLCCALLSLTRYAFIPWLLFAGIWWLSGLWKWIPSFKNKPFKLLSVIPGLIGLFIIVWWLLFNKVHYNKLMMSSFTGRHAYNNVITAGKLIPQSRENAQVQEFFKYIPQDVDITKPWWDMLPFFANAFYTKELTEIEIDNLFLAVSIQGIREHPLRYIQHIFYMALITPNTFPYHGNVLTQLGFPEPDCVICQVKQCRFMWIPDYCQPLKTNQFLTVLFARSIQISRLLYPILTTILMILASLGIVKILLMRNSTLISIALLFLFQHFFQSASEWVEGRFLIPLYPLYAILIVIGLQWIVILCKRISKLFITTD